MKSRHPLVCVLGLTAFVMNPGFACSSSPESEPFEYGEAEMIAAVQGTWRLTYARPEGTATVTFTVQPGTTGNGAVASPPGLAPQCGNRTFTRPAAACTPTSQLALAASVLEADPLLDVSNGRGWYTVHSIRYTGGHLDLVFGNDLRMAADVDVSNAIRQSYVDWQGGRVTSVLERASAR